MDSHSGWERVLNRKESHWVMEERMRLEGKPRLPPLRYSTFRPLSRVAELGWPVFGLVSIYLPTEIKLECLESFPSLTMNILDSTLGR